MKSKLETLLDKEFEQMNVKPWVYHVTEWKYGGRTRHINMFAGVTVVSEHRERDMNDFVGGLAHDSISGTYSNPEIIDTPATWVLKFLTRRGFHGVAICDKRDHFSRARGRIIAKGRLLKHLKKEELRKYNEKMVLEAKHGCNSMDEV